ncbi:hypothetical protein K1T71_006071 [Dendrolimus kikuchii]|uniref:Uncharacterized protein n=1 Tax=Dendrolimus kikuchii TaxID=765133 RepID=A0ACC1D2Y0_9NEOP|nr:hypothetical protein K1T71_006071 [Dendrolimus kikuchii]
METVLKDVEGKQLLCESLYLYGAMLLLCDLYIPGTLRERLLVAFYRYSTSQSQSNIDDVCKLLRDTGYDQHNGKRPLDYPVEYFSRISIRSDFVEKVIGKLRSEDIYNQLAVFTIPEHQAPALATQASMLFVCLFFVPYYLHSEQSKMREIADKLFPNNWIVPIYMGVTMNIIDYWENFKAAKSALSNTCNVKTVKDIYAKRGNAVLMLTNKTHSLLKEGILTDDFVLDNINKILNLLVNSNLVLRSLLLHNMDVTYFDHNKKSKQFKELVLKESSYDPLKILELLISTAELELKVREILNKLLGNRIESWNTNRSAAVESVNSLSELFSGTRQLTKIQENEQLKLWFDNIAKQVSSLNEPTPKAVKKITQLIQALDEVEEFHGIKSTSTIVQYLSESKEALRNLLRSAALKDESLVTLETIADVSYAWCTIDSYTKYMQDSIKENPAVTSRLRALFLKLASAMEIPLLRINQAHSDDLVSVSQYYSNELIRYIQKVLQIIPEMVFNIVEKIIDLQTWTIKEVPTRLDKERLREFAQLEHRMEVAKLTHSASTFTTGVFSKYLSTLVGVVRVDPAELLEKGLLKELDRHISKKFIEFLEPQGKKYQLSAVNLLSRLQKLVESMDGYKRSLEYIQDYINIHGLKIWQKQVKLFILSLNPNAFLLFITGDLITKKVGDNIDGFPFLIGIHTLLRQTKLNNIEKFVNLMCKFRMKVWMRPIISQVYRYKKLSSIKNVVVTRYEFLLSFHRQTTRSTGSVLL